LVNLFERPDLGIRLPLVRGLVGCLDVDAHQVMVGKRGHRGASLGGVVGVEVAGRSGHVDARPTQQDADAADEINGADNSALLAVNLSEGSQMRRSPLAPKPDLRGGPQAAVAAA